MALISDKIWVGNVTSPLISKASVEWHCHLDPKAQNCVGRALSYLIPKCSLPCAYRLSFMESLLTSIQLSSSHTLTEPLLLFLLFHSCTYLPRRAWTDEKMIEMASSRVDFLRTDLFEPIHNPAFSLTPLPLQLVLCDVLILMLTSEAPYKAC